MIKTLLATYFNRKVEEINEKTKLYDIGCTVDLLEPVKNFIFDEYGIYLSCDLSISTTVGEIIDNFNKEMGNDVSSEFLHKTCKVDEREVERQNTTIF